MASARTSDQLTEDDPGSQPTDSHGTRRFVLIAVVGVLVGAVGFVLPGVAAPGGDGPDRAAAVSRASDFATVYNTYDVADLADYQDRMQPLLTEQYYTEFTRVTDALFDALESRDQQSGDVNVLGTAVQTIDEESAVVLVAVDAAITTSADEAAVQRRFRWKVTMSREGDEWLVSQFETITPLDATTGEPQDPEGQPQDEGSGEGSGESAEPSPSPSADEEGEQ